MEIVCLIPARSGSKGIPDKNIKLFKGRPLLAWSIQQAQESKFSNQMRIIVSTDSPDYAKVASQYGAETPFLRPKEISQDLSTDLECWQHALLWLQENQNYRPSIALHLRPTQPCRKVEDIDHCLEVFINSIDSYDSLRTVVPFDKSPYKMYSVDNERLLLNPLFDQIHGISEPFNQCRQRLPTAYLHNGYIDIFKTSIIQKKTISGTRIHPYIMEKQDTIDIDSMEDWDKAEGFYLGPQPGCRKHAFYTFGNFKRRL